MHDLFKQAMSRFASGVCVMTYQNPQTGEADGVTISAFSSLSLTPTKILFCLGDWGKNSDNFMQLNEFTVNILNNKQSRIAYQFAGQSREDLHDQFTLIDGLPAIKDTLATVVCNKGKQYKEGDHDIIIGEVRHIVLGDTNLSPLLYYKSAIIEDFTYV